MKKITAVILQQDEVLQQTFINSGADECVVLGKNIGDASLLPLLQGLESEYALLYMKTSPIELSKTSLKRFLSVADDTGASMERTLRGFGIRSKGVPTETPRGEEGPLSRDQR